MNQITGLLANKRIAGGIFLLASVLVFTFSIQDNSQKLKRVTNLESGIQTCFARVNQTYTAKLLGEQTSQYLTQNFQSLTEECFAEGILNVEETLKTDLPVVAKKLSTLASNVHWFHEDSLSLTNAASGLTAGNEGTEGRNIGTRFETIETTKDEVLDSAEQFKSTVSNRIDRDKNFFYVASALLVIVLVLEYMATANRKISNIARENEAAAELFDRGGVESVKIGEIIGIALEQNDLQNCAKLFHNFYSTRNGYMNTKSSNRDVNALETLITPDQIEKIWNSDVVGVSVDRPVKPVQEFNLNQVTGRAIDLLAEKIFSQGIHLKSIIAEHITIKGKEEELEQVFYHLISSAVTASTSTQISMNAQRLGDIVILDIALQSNGSNEMMKSIDMKICQTLLDEINAKMKIDNTLDQMGSVSGTKIKVIFIAGQDLTKEPEHKKLPSRGSELLS